MRICIIGGPGRGKSTLAVQLCAEHAGIPIFCSDPASLVENPSEHVQYLPEGLSWSAASRYVADIWFKEPGSWIIEGCAVVRALRKFQAQNPGVRPPCDKLIYLSGDSHRGEELQGQAAMSTATRTYYDQIAWWFSPDMVEIRY